MLSKRIAWGFVLTTSSDNFKSILQEEKNNENLRAILELKKFPILIAIGEVPSCASEKIQTGRNN